ncbi:hypothetical protein COCNU_01G014510 [Cocos nucifera]|uniref:Very-long-chain aldehyde decarbonylase CER1-like C-terminal domain-containing protein n=1 Tax=Cocos nucifera TaxID=13894 RepID=A0A8K0HVU5_COCNU|nr:hypothetical protein COCNU_01G014510 [Cocos nucifera]
MLFLTRTRRVIPDGVDFKQIDGEWDWDNFLILQALIGAMAFCFVPSLRDLPFWDLRGCIVALLFHVGVSEPLFYWVHRYHSLHHIEKNSNFCLFMPIFDVFGRTLNSKSWELQKEISSGKSKQVPDFVFLAHVVDVISSMHVPFVSQSCGSEPFVTKLFMLPLWPLAFWVMLLMWAWSKTFLVTFYNLRGRLHQTWAVPRYGFQYFLPSAKNGINHQIELAILRADKMGVKVLSLAALNKNEALNGGGTLFVSKHPNLKVRVVHGNTLTAAVILNEIPKDVKEVFLTGATSKLGRAIALYLCRKKIRVLMLTLSTERFLKIQREASPECQHYLVQVTKCRAAQNCKNEALNGGGTLFVSKHPNLKVRVVHGNTLTAAVILNEIPKDVKEVFLTGATSKLGRAIALYLCRKKIRVLVKL